ncbi:MAG: ABC transporter ATP-binding protein/permease [Planctomycetaceae bacterium]|nr:ABC transporter ATP-binding protein/permease [Planctomycetaceae bacterium]
MDKTIKQDLLRFYTFVKPYRLRGLGAMAITALAGSLDGVIAIILKPYIDLVILGDGSASNALFPILIVVFAVVQSLFDYGSNYLSTWVGKHIGNDIKMALFGKLTHSDTVLFDKNTSGDIILRYCSDADTSSEALLNNVKTFVTRLVMSVVLIGVLLYNSWILAIVAVGVLVVAVVPLNKVRKRLKQYNLDYAMKGAEVTTNYTEAYSGNRVITSYNLHDYAHDRLRATLDRLFRLSIKMVQRTNIMSLSMHFATSLGIAATIWLQGYLIQNGHMTPGNLVSFMAALLMLYQPIKKIGNTYTKVQASIMAIQRVLAVLDITPSITSPADAKRLDTVRDGITYDNVFFSYKPGRPVLRGIDLQIRPGESIAFVGSSGGGKTTLVNLLPRFYDVTSGSIRIDGVDVRELDLTNLRNLISIVFQDNFLFFGTIRENIMLGKRDASEDELRAAVSAACLDDFVYTLEKGLDTHIGERGVMLSGGQRQRVAIARAFIKSSPIVILDEATSALDNESEKVVQQAIENLMQNRTVLIIAHRLSTVVNADRIVVLKDGRIAEMGKHEELLARDGVYAFLYKTQTV